MHESFNITYNINLHAGLPLTSECHYWKQLPPPPKASRLSVLHQRSNIGYTNADLANRTPSNDTEPTVLVKGSNIAINDDLKGSRPQRTQVKYGKNL